MAINSNALGQLLGSSGLYSAQRDEWEMKRQLMDQMQAMQNLSAQHQMSKTESKPVPPPEPNKVLLLLGDEE